MLLNHNFHLTGPLSIFDNVSFSCQNLELLASFNKFNILGCSLVYISRFRLINLKKKLKWLFCCFSGITNLVAPLSSSNFSTKLIC